MIKASVRGRCDEGKGGMLGTVHVDGGDIKLRASVSDSTFADGLALTDLSLSVEKPGSFIVDWDVPKRDVRFQFMNMFRVMDKPLSLTYTDRRGENRTAIDGSLVLDSANKLSASYALDSRDCRLKYNYSYRGNTMLEPTYNLANNSWDFVVSHRVCSDDVLRLSYKTSSRVLGMEWAQLNGGFKLSASVDLNEKPMNPKLSAESIWTFEL